MLHLNCLCNTSRLVVEVIKQCPERVNCWSLLFHGDVVYIGSAASIVQWNVVTDSIATLEGCPGLRSN